MASLTIHTLVESADRGRRFPPRRDCLRAPVWMPATGSTSHPKGRPGCPRGGPRAGTSARCGGGWCAKSCTLCWARPEGKGVQDTKT